MSVKTIPKKVQHYKYKTAFPDGIDGKGPSGAPANRKLFISEFCCVSGVPG